MKFNILHERILFTILGCIIGFLLSLHQYSTYEKEPTVKKQFTIAFATKTAPYHDNAAKGFRSAAEKDTYQNYAIETFITEGQNKLLSTSIINEALNRKPDLLCVVGATLSQVAHSLSVKRKVQTPILFIGATDPVGLGIITSVEKPGGNITGVNMFEIEEGLAAEALHLLKPNAQHILLPYCPLASGGDVEKQALYVKAYLEQRGTSVTLIPIHKQPEIIPKVKALIHSADTVMYLSGCLVDEASEGLIKLCDQHNVTLFASDPTTVKKGAAFGFGTDAQLVGKQAFKYARKILIDGVHPSNLPIFFIDKGKKIAVNLDTAARQGLTIPEELLLCLSRGVVYKNGEEL